MFESWLPMDSESLTKDNCNARRMDMRSATLLRTKTRATLGAATAAVILLAATSAVRADDSANILKSMTDYLGTQKSLSASFDSDIEIITPELQKIQFASSGQMKLSRPDKLRVRRTGGYADVELVYDGKTISVHGNNAKSYVQADLPGTVDQMIDAIQARSGVGMPGTDLLLSNAFDELMASALEGKHIGLGVVDGVECEHLAFRGQATPPARPRSTWIPASWWNSTNFPPAYPQEQRNDLITKSHHAGGRRCSLRCRAFLEW